jgi:hypothetical protein
MNHKYNHTKELNHFIYTDTQRVHHDTKHREIYTENFAGADLNVSRIENRDFTVTHFDRAEPKNLIQTTCNFDGLIFNCKFVYEYLLNLGYFFTLILDQRGQVCLLANKENPNQAELDKPLKKRFTKLTKVFLQTKGQSWIIKPYQ